MPMNLLNNYNANQLKHYNILARIKYHTFVAFFLITQNVQLLGTLKKIEKMLCLHSYNQR